MPLPQPSEHDFRCGELSPEEWLGEWRATSVAPPLGRSEWLITLQDLEMFVARLPAWEDLRVDRTRAQDRTLSLDVLRCAAISPEIVVTFRNWLADPSRQLWRLRVSTDLGIAGALMIYPRVVRVGSHFAHLPLDDALRAMRASMGGSLGRP